MPLPRATARAAFDLDFPGDDGAAGDDDHRVIRDLVHTPAAAASRSIAAARPSLARRATDALRGRPHDLAWAIEAAPWSLESERVLERAFGRAAIEVRAPTVSDLLLSLAEALPDEPGLRRAAADDFHGGFRVIERLVARLRRRSRPTRPLDIVTALVVTAAPAAAMQLAGAGIAVRRHFRRAGIAPDDGVAADGMHWSDALLALASREAEAPTFAALGVTAAQLARAVPRSARPARGAGDAPFSAAERARLWAVVLRSDDALTRLALDGGDALAWLAWSTRGHGVIDVDGAPPGGELGVVLHDDAYTSADWLMDVVRVLVGHGTLETGLAVMRVQQSGAARVRRLPRARAVDLVNRIHLAGHEAREPLKATLTSA